MTRFPFSMLAAAAALALPLAVLGTAGLPPHAAQRAEAAIAGSARDYLRVAFQIELMEVESARLALDKAGRDDVKAFARLMLADHVKATERLREAASRNSLATPPARLDAATEAKLKALGEMSGEEFDRHYVETRVSVHADALALHRTYATTGEGAVLKAAAAEIEQMVERHLALARKLMASLKGPS